MDRYAQIHEGVVVNVIESDTDPDGINGRWVPCGGIGPGWLYDAKTGEFTPPVEDTTAAPEWAWYMDHGPFTDRLGPAATFAIDTSTEPAFVAIRADFSRRKWIDMKDPRVAATVRFLAGHSLPGFATLATPLLTDAEADAVLNTPVPLSANLALRKLYFS